MTADPAPLYAAVDLGGTKVRAVVADGSGRVLGDDIRPSGAAEGLATVLARMVEAAMAELRRLERQSLQQALSGEGYHSLWPQE